VPLSEYRGQVVLINFWSPECPPCIREIPDLKDLQKRFSDRDFTILGVGVHFDELGKGVTEEDIRRIRRTRQRFDFNFPIFTDDGNVQAGFGGLSGVPEHVLVNRHGRVVHRMIGALRPEAMARQVEKQL
jgi:thiol-disulfide isomerase/thioredoxin